MPHRMDPKHPENMDILIEAILSLESEEECRAFLQDLCTMQELILFAQRVQVAKRLLAGETYESIRSKVQVSSSTITRINTALQFGTGGYQAALDRLKENSEKEEPQS